MASRTIRNLVSFEEGPERGSQQSSESTEEDCEEDADAEENKGEYDGRRDRGQGEFDEERNEFAEGHIKVGDHNFDALVGLGLLARLCLWLRIHKGSRELGWLE